MMKGWEIKKLSEISTVYNGNSINETVKKEKYTDITDGLPYIATKDVSYENVINYDNGIKIPYKERSSFKVAPKNTVLICAEGGSAGRKIGFTNQEVCFGNKLFALTTDKRNESRFVYYYYFSSAFQKYFSSELAGIIGGVSMNKFKEIPIPLPPLPEQQRIVTILDEAFAAINKAKENAEKNLQNAKDLFQSELNSIFTKKGDDWEEKRLSEIAFTFGRGKSKHRPRNDKKLYGGAYPFIQTGDVRNSNKFITQYSQTYNEIGLAQSKLWPKGTICITIAANIAETGIIDFDSCFPDSMIGLIVDPKKADVNFTYYALQFLKSVLQLLGKGSAQDNINMGTFETQTFPFPKLETQKKIVHQLETLSTETKKLEAIYQQKLNALDELKKSILQKAFEGELKMSQVTEQG